MRNWLPQAEQVNIEEIFNENYVLEKSRLETDKFEDKARNAKSFIESWFLDI